MHPCFPLFPTGIISTGQMHLYLAVFFHRDYFDRLNASLLSSFSPQGLFRPAGCISIFLFFTTGIISPRSDTSPSLKESLPVHSVNFRFICPGTEREKGRMKNFRFPHVLSGHLKITRPSPWQVIFSLRSALQHIRRLQKHGTASA